MRAYLLAGIFSEFTHVGHAALDVVGMKGGGLAVGRIWFAGVVQMEGIFKSARPQCIAVCQINPLGSGSNGVLPDVPRLHVERVIPTN